MCGYLKRVRWIKTRTEMKRFYMSIFAVLALTVLAVLFVPGVDDYVEQTFQRYLGRAAR